MNKNEYLGILSQRLSVLPPDEYNNTMQYYAEYFEEAGLENEASVIMELGDVNLLADRILCENGQQPFSQPQNNVYGQMYNQPYGQPFNPGYMGANPQPYPAPKREMSTGVKILLGIVTIPLWIVMGSLIFGFGTASASILASSIAVVIAGIAVMGIEVMTGVAFVGAGFITIAVGIGFMIATGAIAQGTRAMFRAIFKRSQKASM